MSDKSQETTKGYAAGCGVLVFIGFMGFYAFSRIGESKPAEESAPAAKMSPREEYLLTARGAAVTLAQAHAANMCQLRSDLWLKTFDTGYQMELTREANRLGVSKDDLKEGDRQTEQMYRETMSMTSCRSLLNSATMARLDELQSAMTGGYR